MKKQNIEICIMIAVITIFCVITIPRLLNHVVWFDETHAWTVAKEINLFNIIQTVHNEGHLIIWFLILMPFAKLNLWFPYSLKFFNWIFYFLAILYMWKNAPFNILFKIIITFSWLSLFYFPIISRCYTIGILGIFILAGLYKDKIKRPILYSSILVLTAHTSLLATFPVIPFACIFFYEIIKSDDFKKNKSYLYSLIILIIGALLWILPFINGYGTPENLSENPPTFNIMWNFFQGYNYTLGISYLLCWLFVFFTADKKIKFFLFMTTFEFMLFFWLIYCAYGPQIIFLYIYLIAALWLTPKLYKGKWRYYIFIIIFALLSSLDLYYLLAYIYENSDKTNIANYINSQKPNYVVVPWKDSDFSPVLQDNIKVIILNSKNDIEMEQTKGIEEYVLNMLIPNDNHWEAILVTRQRVNKDSMQFFCSATESPSILYLTKLKK